jgi:predicted nucleotidyltransferase
MTDRLALGERHRAMLEALLREHVPEAEVWAYGSRVNGAGHEASDLDLAVRGPGLQPLGPSFSALLEALQACNLPILVQAHDWATLPEGFRREIERDYVVVRRGSARHAPGSSHSNG